MQRDPHWIDGKPAQPANGQWLDVFDPASAELSSQVADGDARDVDAAVAAAQAAFPAWSSLPLSGLYVDMLRRLLMLSNGTNPNQLSSATALPAPSSRWRWRCPPGRC